MRGVEGGRRAQAVYNKVGARAQGEETDAPMRRTGRQIRPGWRRGGTSTQTVSGGCRRVKHAGLRMHLVIDKELVHDVDQANTKDSVEDKDG